MKKKKIACFNLIYCIDKGMFDETFSISIRAVLGFEFETPGVNFINILCEVFLPISFCKKKSHGQTVIWEKLYNLLLYEKMWE